MTNTALIRGFIFSLFLHALSIAALLGTKIDLRFEQKPIIIDLRAVDIPDAKSVRFAPKEFLAQKPAPPKTKITPAQKQAAKPAPPVDINKKPPAGTEMVETTKAEEKPDIPDASGVLPGGRRDGLDASRRSTGGKTAGGDDNREDAVASYLRERYDYIGKIINRNISYPLAARKMSMEGRVVLSFVIMKDGAVRDLTIERSSGHRLLDRNAEAAVKNSAPFAAPPAEARVVIPITYKLQ